MAPTPIVITANDGITTLTGEADFPSGPPGGPPFKSPAGGQVDLLTDSTGNHALISGGDSAFGVSLNSLDGSQELAIRNAGFTIFGGGPATQQAITGALSTVLDAPAKDVLTSIIAALVAYGLVTNGTT